MPRPITKNDIKIWRGRLHSFRVTNHDVLGLLIKSSHGPAYAYQTTSSTRWPDPMWVNKQTIEKRKKLGHPKKRVKQMLQDGPFSLDEMAIAEAIINGG